MKATQERDDGALVATVMPPSQAGQRVVWNKAKGEFDLQLIRDQPSQRQSSASVSSSSYTTCVKSDALTAESLDAALNNFETTQLRYEASFFDFQCTKSQLTQRILSSGSPMKYLPKLLRTWSALLGFFSEREDATTPAPAANRYYETSLCEELLEIAQTFKSVGDMTEARAHLGKCIALARRLGHSSQKEPAAATMPSEVVFEKAKKALSECITFQESLANCQCLVLRSKTPPQVLAYLVCEMELLSSQAPFSLEILRIRTDLLWRTRQYAAIVNCMSASSSLADMDAHLTFTHARALESLGLYQQSLNVVAKWQDNEDFSTPAQHLRTGPVETVVTALHSHKQRLELLLEWKSKAERLQRDEKHQDAAHCYLECVDLLGNDYNNSVKASLLFNRANMTMMATSSAPTKEAARLLSSAISDLTLSLKLNPSNQLAKLRLDTALLQLETEKLKSRIK